MSRGKRICQLLFGTADEFRECATNFNELPPAEVAKVTLGQLRVLKAVHLLSSRGDEGGIMLKTLAAKIDLTPGAASIIVDSLVKMKLLDRLPDENDRRAVKIRLSQLGEEQFRRHFDYFFNTMDEILSAVPEEEFATFEKIFVFLQEGVHALRATGRTASRQRKKYSDRGSAGLRRLARHPGSFRKGVRRAEKRGKRLRLQVTQVARGKSPPSDVSN